ncbi:hypothetical protein BX666DRAFT_230149 [Dichotomocladium elegans]|nr:hypothetical protein BX666DRAFT_230149 [Dichotomocladium elegans]
MDNRFLAFRTRTAATKCGIYEIMGVLYPSRPSAERGDMALINNETGSRKEFLGGERAEKGCVLMGFLLNSLCPERNGCICMLSFVFPHGNDRLFCMIHSKRKGGFFSSVGGGSWGYLRLPCCTATNTQPPTPID